MSDGVWSLKKRILFLLGVTVMVAFLAVAIYIDSANAELDMGDIRSFTDNRDSEFFGCEFLSITDGMFVPIELRLESIIYSPNFSARAEIISGEAEFSDENVVSDNDAIYRFSTDSPDAEFRIIFTDNTGNRTGVHRDYFYRMEVSDANNAGNIERELGSWHTDENSFCKVIEFRTEEPFTERTEEEILEITEADRKKDVDAIMKLLSTIEASFIFITIAWVLIVVYTGGDKIFQLMNRGKAEREANKINALHSKKAKEFKDMVDYGYKKFAVMEMNIDQFKHVFVSLFYDAMKHIKEKPNEEFEFKFKIPKNPYIEMVSKHKGLDLKDFAKNLREKLQHKEKDEKAEFIETVDNSDDLDELFEKTRKEAIDSKNDLEKYNDLIWRCEYITSVMDKRRKGHG